MPQALALGNFRSYLLLEICRAVGDGLLVFLELAILDSLLGVNQRTPPLFRKLFKPIQSTRRNTLTHRNRQIYRQATPLELIEQHHDFGFVGFHPYG